MGGGGDTLLFYLIAAAGGYALGSVPFGLLLTRLAGVADIRRTGSGNIGATNVLRAGGKGLAAATLLLDGGKGAVAVLLFTAWSGEDPGLSAGLAAVLGHNFPVWLRFRGGKGVATSLGVLLAAMWPVGVLACLTWLATAALFRYSSLAALAALAAAPFYAWWLETPHHTALAVVLALLGIVRHHENIGRLLKGTESRIGKKNTS